MESDTIADVNRRTITGYTWASGAIAGIIAGGVFGLMMQTMMVDILMMAIPGMYGIGPSLTIGWILHLFHSAIFGLIYAGVSQHDLFSQYTNKASTGTGVGIVYGIAIWIIAASFIMPAWVGLILPMDPPVPDFNPMSLVGHIVFGAILGVIYPMLTTSPR